MKTNASKEQKKKKRDRVKLKPEPRLKASVAFAPSSSSHFAFCPHESRPTGKTRGGILTVASFEQEKRGKKEQMLKPR